MHSYCRGQSGTRRGEHKELPCTAKPPMPSGQFRGLAAWPAWDRRERPSISVLHRPPSLVRCEWLQLTTITANAHRMSTVMEAQRHQNAPQSSIAKLCCFHKCKNCCNSVACSLLIHTAGQNSRIEHYHKILTLHRTSGILEGRLLSFKK